VLEQPHRPVLSQPGGPGEKPDRAFPAGAARQIVADEKARDIPDILASEIERGLVADALQQRSGVTSIPARQHLEFRPADAEELVARRIVQRPGGRAVERARSRIKPDL